MFLIGCHTAQRISDYSTITKQNLTKTGQGHNVITLLQVKTGNRVIIPIKPELMSLLKKYNFSVPHVIEQKLNERIKQIGRMAGIDESIQITSYTNGMKLLLHVPKYKLIQSQDHTKNWSNSHVSC